MKNLTARTFFATLIVSLSVVAFDAKAQLTTASALLTAHNANHLINSAEDFSAVMKNIDMLSTALHRTYASYPNMQYTPSYENDQLIGFVITGVNDSKEADKISLILMELQSLSDLASAADLQLLPEGDNNGRVSKKHSRM